MMTPAQYQISGGSLGGGFGRWVSVELGLKVNRSTREKTLVWQVDTGGMKRCSGFVECLACVGIFAKIRQ
jgi:hypothetical protein